MSLVCGGVYTSRLSKLEPLAAPGPPSLMRTWAADQSHSRPQTLPSRKSRPICMCHSARARRWTRPRVGSRGTGACTEELLRTGTLHSRSLACSSCHPDCQVRLLSQCQSARRWDMTEGGRGGRGALFAFECPSFERSRRLDLGRWLINTPTHPHQDVHWRSSVFGRSAEGLQRRHCLNST